MSKDNESMKNTLREIGVIRDETVVRQEDMLAIICVFIKDILEHHNVEQADGLNTDKQGMVLLRLLSVLNMLLPIYRQHEAEIPNQSSLLKKRLEAATAEMQKAVEELSDIEEELKKLAEEESKVKGELQKVIDKKAEVENANKDICDLQKKIEELEAQITKQKAVLAEISVEDLKKTHTELTNEYTIMNNVVSSILNDTYLKASHENGDEELTVGENADLMVMEESFTDVKELDDWFKGLSSRVKSLLNVFEGVLDSIVKMGEASTAEKPKEKSNKETEKRK